MRGLDAAVADYIAHHRLRATRELEYFRRLRTDEEAVSKAALAELPSGKRHPHQRRIPRSALEVSERRLVMNLDALRAATTFDELHGLIETLIRPIFKIGELAVYDTSLRIGARFGLDPDSVYLHAGTREGAKALGVSHQRRTIPLNELPVALEQLRAREIEDLLCVYKRLLGPVPRARLTHTQGGRYT